MKLTILAFLFLCFLPKSQAQEKLLQSGPMAAYSTMREVLLWVQTTESAKVQIEYWEVENPKEKLKTEPLPTLKENSYVAHLIADQIEPSREYAYALYINNKLVQRPYRLRFEAQPIWKWRGDAPDFSFATGSCTYIGEEAYDRPGDPYGGGYQIYEDIYKKAPNFMLWLGDNVYLREADWNSKTGIRHRYTHSRSAPEMQPMLGAMHHYGIWDDHDYGPNNSDRSYHLKKETEKTFKLFFPNNNYIFENGISSYFQWADCDFFLLDNRYWRTPNRRDDLETKECLGAAQIEWLLDALVMSRAPFKFVALGGQLLNPIEKSERMANYAPEERLKILQGIRKLKIEGVVFLSGDVHHTELSKLDIKDGYPLYDLTVSPLTSGAYGKGAEENVLLEQGTLVKERNYAQLKVSGTKKERALEMLIYNSNGKELWKKTIRADELKFKK